MTTLRVLANDPPASAATAEIERIDRQLEARFAPRLGSATFLTRWYWQRRWRCERARALERLAPRLAYFLRK
ncbi:MAG TPA: hypothetical protein VHB77_14455 [Planctomycetaceae bacterium]|nr:hypothetical protein [Planctomycetaceae bacterium]